MPRPILLRTRKNSRSLTVPERNSRSLTVPERNAQFLQNLSEAYYNYLFPALKSDDLRNFLRSENIIPKIIADKVLFREYLDYIKNNIDINTARHREYDGTELYNEIMNPNSNNKKDPYFLATEIFKLMEFVKNKKKNAEDANAYANARRREAERREARRVASMTNSRPMTSQRGGSRKRRHRNSRSKRRHRTLRSKR